MNSSPYLSDKAAIPARRRFWLGLLVGVLATAWLYPRVIKTSDGQSQTVELALGPEYSNANTTVPISESRRTAIVRAVERMAPAVVTLSVTQLRREHTSRRRRDPLWDLFFPDMGRQRVRRIESMGSGVIVTEQGHIVTNEHVVRNAEQIVVSLPTGEQFVGKLVGEPDQVSDLAVVKIEADCLRPAVLGNSENLIIGEWAISIGNPFGFLIRDSKPTVTVGVISALDRDFDPEDSEPRAYRSMIQTDASINQGNSGGPLVNGDGEVIGINTFIFSRSGGSLGIGFAIPINRAKVVMDDLLRHGTVRHNVWTGVSTQDLNPWIAQSLGLESDDGAIITDVVSKSPGDKAGLIRGDVIIAVEGKQVRSVNDVQAHFLGAIVGDVVVLGVIRDGSRRAAEILLEENPRSRRRRPR